MVAPKNINLGTQFQDGLRVGPHYTGVTATNPATSSAITAVTDFGKWGPGVLMAPIASYSIVPNETAAGNIVAARAQTANGYLPLAAGAADGATTAALGADGETYIQFDYPRVVSVSVIGAVLASAATVTIYGTDWYGIPLQQNITVGTAIGTYPDPLATFSTECKAFYTVTGVYWTGTTEAGGTISVQAMNTFGLPWRINGYGSVVNFSWDANDMRTPYGLATLVVGGGASAVTVTHPAVLQTFSPVQVTCNTATSGTQGHLRVPLADVVNRKTFVIRSSSNDEVSTINWIIPNGGSNLVKVADATQSATSSDIRGLVKLPEPSQTWANPPNGGRRLVFSYYVAGADAFINQLANAGQPRGAGTQAALTPFDLYGSRQYYIGDQ